MKVLRLGNSDDFVAEVPEELRSWRIAERMLSEEAGEPVETILKSIWANDALPGLIQRWIDQYEPDVVFFKVSNFGLQESVTLRIQRRWPLIGPWLGRTGKRMADTPSVGTRASFLFLRRIALRTIGGETQFTPDEVIARYTTCIRGITARESIVLVVRGTDGGRLNPGLGPKAAAIREAGRLRVHFAMKSLCEGARVTYYGRENSRSAEEHARLIGPDGLHRLAAGQQLAGEDDGRMMVRAWREAHGGSYAAATAADRALSPQS